MLGLHLWEKMKKKFCFLQKNSPCLLNDPRIYVIELPIYISNNLLRLKFRNNEEGQSLTLKINSIYKWFFDHKSSINLYTRLIYYYTVCIYIYIYIYILGWVDSSPFLKY